jgi:hypothetical protein
MFKQRWRALTLKNPDENSNSNERTAFGKIFYQLITRKPLRDIIIETNEGELTRFLSFFALNTLGLGAIIGKIIRQAKLFFVLNCSLAVPVLIIRCWYLHFSGQCCCKFRWSS